LTEPGVRALFDVNVLVALHDADHVHHGRASKWFLENAEAGWASCPLTQNGCVRILSQPGYTNPIPLAQAIGMLKSSCASPVHAFWPDTLSVLDAEAFHHAHMHGHRQLTDLYLLALAVHNAGRFVTFDVRIPLSAVNGAKRHHLVEL
jgi:toxin-antitoxin system PIN domain toxin